MNDQRFFDLAMKVIVKQATASERAELDSLLVGQPELKTEFDRLRAEANVAKEVLPLVNASEATTGEFPAYARERLQTKVRQTFGTHADSASPQQGAEKLSAWGWGSWLGLATVTALVVLLLVPVFSPKEKLVVQIAMLDTVGGTRGTDTNEVAILQQAWKEAALQKFAKTNELAAWELNWATKGPTVKILYDRAAGDVRVIGRWNGKSFSKTFPVEQDLAATLNRVKIFVAEQRKR